MKQVEKMTKFDKELEKHYMNSNWVLTRFDTGAYWLEIQKSRDITDSLW